MTLAQIDPTAVWEFVVRNGVLAVLLAYMLWRDHVRLKQDRADRDDREQRHREERADLVSTLDSIREFQATTFIELLTDTRTALNNNTRALEQIGADRGD